MINAVHRCDWLSSVTGVIYNICDWSVTFLGHYGGCWNRNAPSKRNDSQSFLTFGSGWDGVWVGTWTSEHSISDLGVRGGRPPLSLNKSPTCHITFRSHVCKPTFMSGEGVAGGGMTAADSCQASDRHPRARKTTTRVLTRDIFFSRDRGIQNWTFLTSCRYKLQPKKKKKKKKRVFLTWRRDKFATYHWFSGDVPCEHSYRWFAYVKKFDWRWKKQKRCKWSKLKKKTTKKQKSLRDIIYVQMAFSRDLAKTHYWLCGN